MSLVYGIGINNQEIPSRVNGKQTKEYKLWCRMLERCSNKYWDKFPTYIGVTCSDNFKTYSYFYKWCHKQKGFAYKDDKENSWHLDKDLLIKGNKHYSEDTCVFIPHRLNCILIKSDSTRGVYPVGVYFCKNDSKFKAQCKVGTGSQKHLGYFNTAQDAFIAYKTFKELYIKQLADEYKSQIDHRAYHALLSYKVEITD